jgi:DNA-binding CsgD family transcriptional regulator
VETAGERDRGRASYAARGWTDASTWLARADRAAPLGADDLEMLASAAYLIGRDDDHLTYLERAHRLHVDEGASRRAVRAAFWLGIHLAIKGEPGRATGWLRRARRMLERDERDCAERGYLLSASALEQLMAGDWENAYDSAHRATSIGERFGDADLMALAGIDEGRALARLGRLREGVALLDEVMVAVTAGELSPIVTGLAYCGVIEGCHELYDLRRAQEWTAALAHWCDLQPDLVPFTGTCLLHRAEIMQLHGGWNDALAEARRAHQRLVQRMSASGAGHASYRQGELLRLQGDLDAADEAYRAASRSGCEPQPGLALLRLAQADAPTSAAMIRRALVETTGASRRAALLPAYVEVMLAVDDVAAARSGACELEQIGAAYDGGMLGAIVDQARGAVALSEGDPSAALVLLRRAFRQWHELEAPYESARVRVLVGLACNALGDHDAARLERDAARAVFERLGARSDLDRIASLERRDSVYEIHGLTPRELEVLRLVATGLTNKAIAARLVVSERTVDRHVSNIFRKLDVRSRAAATAYAYQHRLIT